MNTVETFVTVSLHEQDDGRTIIRARFQIDNNGTYRTAFNPKGVQSVEWVQRVTRATGAVKTQSRYPVKVTFDNDSVIGSDIVRNCTIAPRPFKADEAKTPAADAADVALLAKVAGKGVTARVVPAVAEAADDIG